MASESIDSTNSTNSLFVNDYQWQETQPMASDSTDSTDSLLVNHFADSSDEEMQEASREAAKVMQYKEAVIAAMAASIDIMNFMLDELIAMMLLPHQTPSTPPPSYFFKG